MALAAMLKVPGSIPAARADSLYFFMKYGLTDPNRELIKPK